MRNGEVLMLELLYADRPVFSLPLPKRYVHIASGDPRIIHFSTSTATASTCNFAFKAEENYVINLWNLKEKVCICM